jgi:hypothetical protein
MSESMSESNQLYYFRNDSDPNCVCGKSTHNIWTFGLYHRSQGAESEYDPPVYDNDKSLTSKEEMGVQNAELMFDTETCFCCKSQIKEMKYNILHCFDCNSIVCNKCCIQGRYNSDEQLYCFDCRRFSIHKNTQYYFPTLSFHADEDWMEASWYY